MADLKKLDEIVDQLGIQSEKLMNFSEVYAEIDKMKADLEANINSFGTSSEKLDKASDSLQENNKKFQTEFDSDITSKLNKHKSDIEVTVRSEGHETANTIENKLNTTFLKELNNINKRIGFLIMFGVAIVGLNLYLILTLIN